MMHSGLSVASRRYSVTDVWPSPNVSIESSELSYLGRFEFKKQGHWREIVKANKVVCMNMYLGFGSMAAP